MGLQLQDLVPPQQPQRLAGGFQFTEGPVWHPRGYLLFSDIPASTIYRYTPGDGVRPYLRPSHNSNGLALDARGRLIACEHGGRQVSRQTPGMHMATLVSRYNGQRLNSPNDVVVHSSGRIFFTDPPYGLPGQSEGKELDFQGVFRIDPPEEDTPTRGQWRLVLLASDFQRPNGLAFSPDESVLYIADSARRHVRAFQVGPDLSLADGRVFLDMNIDAPGAPDGMKVDVQGNLYIAGPGGVWVATPQGEHLGTIAFPEQPANLAFGGEEYRTLFVTARTSLYSIQVNVPGMKRT